MALMHGEYAVECTALGRNILNLNLRPKPEPEPFT